MRLVLQLWVPASKLITKELVAAKDWDGLATKVRQSVDWIREIRAEMAG